MKEPTSRSPNSPRFPWRTIFQRSTSALFVVGPNRRLRFANAAWEKLTGKTFSVCRGMRISERGSGSALGQALAAPPEVWQGHATSTRRALPDATTGPPWWDITFLPLRGEGDRLLGIVGTIHEVGTATPRGSVKVSAALASLRHDQARRFHFDLLTGASHAAKKLLAQARLAASTQSPVCLIGETGTGKETVARVIHHNSPLQERAFFTIDCAGLQPYLIESQLFGKGGLLYGGHLGTIYLKDPGHFPRDLQERFANIFLQPRPKSPRLITGLTIPVLAGSLIEAFQTALAAQEIRVPALRERTADLPVLVERLWHRHALDPASPLTVADETWPILQGHAWPRNLRELNEVIRPVASQVRTGPFTPEQLPRRLRERFLLPGKPTPSDKPWTLDGVLQAVEKRLIEQAMIQSGQSPSLAAEQLGIVRTRLWRRLEALGLSTPKEAKSRKSAGESAGHG